MSDEPELPEYLRDTLALLRRAFPSGIGDGDMPAVMAALLDGDMSERNVATVLAAYTGRPYYDLLYLTRVCELDETVTHVTKALATTRLMEHGFPSSLDPDIDGRGDPGPV